MNHLNKGSVLNKAIAEIPEVLFLKLKEKAGIVLTPGEIFGARDLWKEIKQRVPNIEELINETN